MIIAFDTTFFALHYFSKEEDVLLKTKRLLNASRKLGNRGILPTMVLAEFYALTHKRAGRDVAEKCFHEMVESSLDIAELSVEASRQAALLRRKYEEKIPWGDCIIAAAGITNKAEFIVSEDPHLQQIREVKTKKLEETKI